MDIIFEDHQLEKMANDYQKCQKKMGLACATKFQKRLNDLRDARTLEDVRNLPGNYHALKHDRRGQWACSLEEPRRLIFTPLENPIPADESGNYTWSEIKGVKIICIEKNYHKAK